VPVHGQTAAPAQAPLQAEYPAMPAVYAVGAAAVAQGQLEPCQTRHEC
jgi:hypothetical protein